MSAQSKKYPSSWSVATLDEVTVIAPSPNIGERADDDIVHFLPMASVEEDFRGVHINQLRKLGEVKKGFTFFQEGDVLFAKITPCMENGKGGLVPFLPYGIGYGSTECSGLIFVDTEIGGI